MEPTTFAGLTVEQYAGIAAAVAEGLPLDTPLAWEGLSRRAWKAADLAWKQRLTQEGPEGPLFREHTEARARAEDWLSRDVAPLSRDLGAWLGFLEAQRTAAAPFEALKASGLRLSDVARLARLWARRFDEKPDMVERAAALVRKGLGPVPKLTFSPVDYKPYPWSRGGAPDPPAADADEDEGEPLAGETPEPLVPPPLLVPSYLKAVADRSAATSPAAGRSSSQVPPGATGEVDLSAVRARLPFGGPAPEKVAIDRAHEVENKAQPERPATPAEKGLTGEVPADLLRRIALGRLPFAGARDPEPRAPLTPEIEIAGDPPAPPDVTAEVDLTSVRARLPFEGVATEEAAIERAHEVEQNAQPRKADTPPVKGLTGDVPVDLFRRIALGPLPFSGSRPARGPRLSLEQYASYRAELTVFSHRPDIILERYGLRDPAHRAREESAWAERLRRNPQEGARGRQLYDAYVRYWMARSRG